MTISVSTNTSKRNMKIKRQDSPTENLERSTVSYMRGEIDLKTYREMLRNIDTRLDLRKIASRLQKANPQ